MVQTAQSVCGFDSGNGVNAQLLLQFYAVQRFPSSDEEDGSKSFVVVHIQSRGDETTEPRVLRSRLCEQPEEVGNGALLDRGGVRETGGADGAGKQMGCVCWEYGYGRLESV